MQVHSASLLYTVYNSSPVATLLCPGLIGNSPGCLSLFRHLSMSFSAFYDSMFYLCPC